MQGNQESSIRARRAIPARRWGKESCARPPSGGLRGRQRVRHDSRVRLAALIVAHLARYGESLPVRAGAGEALPPAAATRPAQSKRRSDQPITALLGSLLRSCRSESRLSIGSSFLSSVAASSCSCLAASSFTLQIGDRRQQVRAAQGGCLGERRVGEVRWIPDAGALLLGGDLAREVGSHVLEIEDHRLERGNLAGFLAGFEALQPQCGVTWLHCSIPPTRSNGSCPDSCVPKRRSDSGLRRIKQATCQTIPPHTALASWPSDVGCHSAGCSRCDHPTLANFI